MTVQHDEGRKAHEDGQSRRENPYDINTEAWSCWMDGFDHAATRAVYHPSRELTVKTRKDD